MIPRLLALLLAAAVSGEPTFYFEWIARSGDASTRLTLFNDRTLVRKTKAGKETAVERRKLSEEEWSHYVEYFAQARRDLGGDASQSSGLTGDFESSSRAVFRPPGAREWTFSFDSFSALSLPAARIRTALEGLRDSFGKVLPSPDDFAPEKIPVGTVLTRVDGHRFRVRRLDADARMVELEGVDEPYSLFVKIADLRFTFKAP